MPAAEEQLRKQYFEYLFGKEEGYVCICTQTPDDKSTFKQHFFLWPSQRDMMSDFIEQQLSKKNLWYGINILSAAERTKAFCKPHNLVWADLDTADPKDIEPTPSVIIESSPKRFQAIWRLSDTIDPYLAQEFSKKIAYKYKDIGVDTSGWDLTQVLRVPFTRNFKYVESPWIMLLKASDPFTPVEVFEKLEVAIPSGTDDPYEIDLPTELPELAGVLYKYNQRLKQTAFFELFDSDPPETADWSAMMWRLINICFEAEMDRSEVFAVVKEAKCNKYDRDNRPIRYLWREVVKADGQQRRIGLTIGGGYKPLKMPVLVLPDEVDKLPTTFVDTYRDWASNSTDAIIDFHNLSAFMLLAFFIAGSVRLPTSSGTIVPNLWGLILGDSTLTRKTTSMRLAMDLLTDIDSSLILASEGSLEGILTGLAGRPNRVSIFYRDEVTGFFEGMQKKDYLAGMRELFTKLYDVPSIEKRILRKEVYDIINPVFMFYGGGIKERLFQQVSQTDIISGFMPRFVVVSGETDISKVRRTGPPTQQLSEGREKIKTTLADLYESYMITMPKNIGNQIIQSPVNVNAKLTEAAWDRYGVMEESLMRAGYDNPLKDLANPTFNRLCVSTLKMGVLLAASRQLPNSEGNITVEANDILGAARYTQDWGEYSIELILNSGRTVAQRIIDKVKELIKEHPGIMRGDIARNYNLSKREMDDVLATLIDRGEVTTQKVGRGLRLWMI